MKKVDTLNREQLIEVVKRLDIKLMTLKSNWQRLAELLDQGASIYDDEVEFLVMRINQSLQD
jgi:hypothetical protein